MKPSDKTTKQKTPLPQLTPEQWKQRSPFATDEEAEAASKEKWYRPDPETLENHDSPD